MSQLVMEKKSVKVFTLENAHENENIFHDRRISKFISQLNITMVIC